MNTKTKILVALLLALWAVFSVAVAVTLDTALTHPLAHHKSGALLFIYGQLVLGLAIVFMWRPWVAGTTKGP